MIRKFTNALGCEVTLKQWDDGRWFIDMGCQLWNRVYNNEKMDGRRKMLKWLQLFI